MRLGMKLGAGAVVAGLLLAGCGGGGGGSNSDSNSNSDSQGTMSGSSSTGDGSASGTMGVTEASATGGMSASGTGTTEQGGSMSDSQTQGGGGSDSTQGMTSGSTGEDSLGGSGGTTEMTTAPPQTTGEPVNCAEANSKDECVMLGCQPVEGQGFEFDGAIWCLKDTFSYLGCIEPAVCAEVISYVCKGQNVYQLPNACAPDDYQPCEPPPDPGMDGYPSCN